MYGNRKYKFRTIVSTVSSFISDIAFNKTKMYKFIDRDFFNYATLSVVRKGAGVVKIWNILNISCFKIPPKDGAEITSILFIPALK